MPLYPPFVELLMDPRVAQVTVTNLGDDLETVTVRLLDTVRTGMFSGRAPDVFDKAAAWLAHQPSVREDGATRRTP